MKCNYQIVGLIWIAIFLQNCSTSKSKFIFDKVLWSTDWSPDDGLIAVGGNINSLNLLSSDNLMLQKSIKKLNTITKIKWHPDGRFLAIARQGNGESETGGGSTQIIDILNETTINLDILYVRGLGWNHSGTQLAVGDGEGELRIYSKEGLLIKSIQTEQKSITGLSWHPDDDRIVTVGSHIEIIEVGSEQKIKIIPREIEILMLCVEWHPSGEFFVTGDYGDFIVDYPPLLMFWDSKGKNISRVKRSKAEYRNLKWTRKGDRLVTASDKLRLWSKDGSLIKERNLGSLLWGVDWNSTDDKIVTTSEDGKVFVLDKKLNKIKTLR